MNLFFYDLETTGLDASKCAIHQLSAMIEIDGKLVDVLDYRIKPHKGAYISQSALAVSNTSYSDLLMFQRSNIAYINLTKELKKYGCKFNLVGYNNPSFDDRFLTHFFNIHMDSIDNYFHEKSIDVMKMAQWVIPGKRTKLSEAYEAITGKAVNGSRLHSAVYDVVLTRELYRNLIKQNNPV